MQHFKITLQNLIVTLVLAATVLGVSAAPVAAESIFERMQTGISEFELVSGGEDPDATAQSIVGRVIGAFLSVFGIIFLGLMIYGGYKWMMASGRDEEVSTAKATIRSAIIGLIIVLAAYTITYFVTTSLQSATG